MLKVASAVAIALALAASTSPASAGGCLQGCWPASDTGWATWPDLFGDIHGGVLTRAIVGTYPANKHGFNSSACIAYQEICDQAGHVIGRRPIPIC
jgi:hypothetical protein